MYFVGFSEQPQSKYLILFYYKVHRSYQIIAFVASFIYAPFTLDATRLTKKLKHYDLLSYKSNKW
jgi:hypothetical protein